MIDARQSFFELKSKCFFFFGGGGGRRREGGGGSPSSEIEPVHNKYVPFPLAYRFLEAIDYIRSHLSLNINDYRDSASVARH